MLCIRSEHSMCMPDTSERPFQAQLRDSQVQLAPVITDKRQRTGFSAAI